MKKLIAYILIAFISLPCLATTCAIESDGVPEDMINISMVSIIANNKALDKKVVSVTGVLNAHSNNKFQLYKDKNSVEYMILSESIFLSIDKNQDKKYRTQLDNFLGQYVNVVGVFHSEQSKDAGYLADIIFICEAMTRSKMDRNAEEAARKWGPKKDKNK